MGRWRAVQGWTLLALLMTLIGPATAQRYDGDDRDRDDWRLIGSAPVGYALEIERIDVGRRAGRFANIRLRARGNDIQVGEVRVVFENGETKEFELRQRLPEGAQTNPVDLGRGGRFIDRIEILARERPSFRKRGVIEVYGEPAEDEDRGWKVIGAQVLGFTPRREVIDIGRQQGRFSKIRFRARDGDIYILDATAFFGDGERQTVGGREQVEDGELSRPVDLDRRGRFIDRIELSARARPRLRRPVKIEVLGEEARGGPGWPGQEDWELIGSYVVGFTLDEDRIEIDRRAGGYKNLRLRARGDDIYVRDFRVVYANGRDDQFRVGETIREGELTRPVDVDDDAIREIEVSARARPSFKRRAVLEVYGEKRRGPPEARWEELGCQKVGFLADRDVIRVGREEGRFRAIQLRVTGNSVFMQDLRLVYGDGTVDDYRVAAEIPEGGQTRPIDLRGRRRFLDRIIMIYRAKPNFRGSARLCVYARE